MRTIEGVGGVCASRPDLYVPRLPPTTRHFLSQRIRQAYDEFARPRVLLTELLVLPLVALGVATRRFRVLGFAALALVALAARGRAIAGGRARFPATTVLFAPLWVLERGVCAWLALLQRMRGGARYAGGRIARAASGTGRDRASRI